MHLYQRPYNWTVNEWKIPWTDIVELSELDKPGPHFLGLIVTLPTVSVAEGIPKMFTDKWTAEHDDNFYPANCFT